jgi:hypothetical protein
MNPNQRSETNNQTNNGANEKGTPGSQGKTISDAPLDHTYSQGGSQQQDQGGTRQSGTGPAAPDDVIQQRGNAGRADLPGGSMQTQQTGGTGAVQGITDSHQRAMEERSGAYGQLEQPVGGRREQPGNFQSQSVGAGGNGPMNAQSAAQPELQGGSGTRGGGQHGPLSKPSTVQGGSMGSQQSEQQSGRTGQSSGIPSVQRGGAMGAEQSTDRAGSRTGSYQGTPGTHQSNDTAGGLPRSPGNTGATNAPPDTHLSGAQVHANQQKELGGVHNSNDVAGGYPKSPGGANKLAADEKMDDDTGFSNKP